MVELRKTIKNLIIIAVIMPLVMVGVVVWRYGTEHVFNVASVYIIMIGTIFGANRKIKEALHNLNIENDEEVKIDVEENNHKKPIEKN